MQRLLWLAAAALLLTSCLSTSGGHIAPARAIGAPPAPVVVHAAELPPGASTFSLVQKAGTAAPWLEALVAALLERRGWSSARAAGADVALDVSAGDWTSTRKSGLDFPTSGVARQVAIRLMADQTSWEAEMTSFAHTYPGREGILRLALSAADELPLAASPSAESRALAALGADFVLLPVEGETLSPVLVGVEPGSAAAGAGWRPRDVLVAVAGTPTAGAGWREVAARLGAAAATPIAVEIERDGKPYSTTLVPRRASSAD